MADVKIFAEQIEGSAESQIQAVSKLTPFENETIRVMPDAHVGKGCIVGFTSTFDENLVTPNVIGVDIGCGVLSVETTMKASSKTYKKLDNVIANSIPTGIEHHSDPDKSIVPDLISELSFKLDDALDSLVCRSLGTLGGGNHFIELDQHPETKKLWLTVHTGSRNFGLQIAEHHQDIALETDGFLKGPNAEAYLHDVALAQAFAKLNRRKIVEDIQGRMGFKLLSEIESVHNYYDMDDGMIRKGAISALAGQKVVIPLNMAAGIVLAEGLGNADWNRSAPHGAGRKMTRVAAKEKISLDQYRKDMNGVYSTHVSKKTLDESPRAYKNSKSILRQLPETVTNIVECRSVYNFKAS